MNFRKMFLPFLSMALIFTSCSPKPSNNNNGDVNYYPDEEKKDYDKDQGEYIPPKPNGPGEYIPGQDNPGGNNEIVNNIPDNSVLKRAYKLADNVDTLPYMEELFALSEAGGDNNPSNKKMQKRTRKRDNLGYTEERVFTPTLDETYLEYPGLHCYFKQYWDAIDRMIEFAKETKDRVVSRVVQFDTWVNFNDGTDQNYKLAYDKNKDTVYIELYSNYDYYQIESYYNEEGKIVIFANNYYGYGNHLRNKEYTNIKIEYVEDNYWIATRDEFQFFSDGNYVDYNFVYKSDLTKDYPEVSQFYGTNFSDGTCEWRQVLSTGYNDVLSVLEEMGYGFHSNERAYAQLLYDSNGYNLIRFEVRFEPNRSYRVYVPLYKVDGWTKEILYHAPNDRFNGTYELVIGDNHYFDYDENNFYVMTKIVDGISFSPAGVLYGVDMEPGICIEYDSNKYDAMEATEIALNSLGLSYKENKSNEMRYLDEHLLDLVRHRNVFGYEDVSLMSDNEMKEIYDKYSLALPTQADVDRMNSITSIDVSKQEMSELRYEMLQPVVTNKVKLSEEELDFSELSIEVPKSALLSSDSEYKVALGYYSENEFNELASSDLVRFDPSKNLVFSFNEAKYDLNDLESFTNNANLVALFFRKTGDSFERLSEPKELLGEGDNILIRNEDVVVEKNYESYKIVTNTDIEVKEAKLESGKVIINHIADLSIEVDDMEELTLDYSGYITLDSYGNVSFENIIVELSGERLKTDSEYYIKLYTPMELYEQELTSTLVVYDEETDKYIADFKNNKGAIINFFYMDEVKEIKCKVYSRYNMDEIITYGPGSIDSLVEDGELVVPFNNPADHANAVLRIFVEDGKTFVTAEKVVEE